MTPEQLDALYEHPGYRKPYPIETVLLDLAAGENCDGEPYDAMVYAATAITRLRASGEYLRAALAASEARVAELEAERYALSLAICGGEDAPGYASSLTVAVLEEVARSNRRMYDDEITRANRNVKHWRQEVGKLHSQLGTANDRVAGMREAAASIAARRYQRVDPDGIAGWELAETNEAIRALTDADLPPTLAAALALPEIGALVEALRYVADQATMVEIPERNRDALPRMSKSWNNGYDVAVGRARTALAALTPPADTPDHVARPDDMVSDAHTGEPHSKGVSHADPR